MDKYLILLISVMTIGGLCNCSNRTENNQADADAADSQDVDAGESWHPDVIDGVDAQDILQDSYDDPQQDSQEDQGEDAAEDVVEESDMPWGTVKPRCGDSFVESCTDCPDRPYVCDPCELSANCVADCDADCSGGTACPESGACAPWGVVCATEIFCGCPPHLKKCNQGETESCVADCAAECPDRPTNSLGVCYYPEAGCPDGEGPEYFCEKYYPDGTGMCSASCDECGATYCTSGSCSAGLCETGYLPGYAFYDCAELFCCEEGFLCKATSTCVASCSECPGATTGACDVRGVCVADCLVCFHETTEDLSIQVCDGVCVDLLTNQWNCGACGSLCSSGMGATECSMGHCCIGSFSDPPPFVWCEECDCCLHGGFSCTADACAEGCLNPP